MLFPKRRGGHSGIGGRPGALPGKGEHRKKVLELHRFTLAHTHTHTVEYTHIICSHTHTHAHTHKAPELPDFVDNRDWSGALGLLKFQLNMEEITQDSSIVTEKTFWMAYCYMHLGEFQEAVDRLDDHLNHDPEPEPSVWLWKAVCKYGQGLFKEAEECAFRGPQGLRLARTSLLKCPAQTSQRAAFEWRHC